MERNSLPYMAGIIDSEGTISLSEITKPSNNSGFGTRLSVSVANTDSRLMKWLTTNFGGVISSRSNDRGLSYQFPDLTI